MIRGCRHAPRVMASSLPRALAMPRQLMLANALFSLRGRVAISDGTQQPRFQARGEFALFSPTWRLYQGAVLVGSLRRKLLSLRPHWDITLGQERFALRGQLLSWRRHYTVAGGRWHGAQVTGSLLDRSFRIENQGLLLADARVRWLSLSDAQQVQVHADDDASEQFAAMAMLVVQLARQVGRRRAQ